MLRLLSVWSFTGNFPLLIAPLFSKVSAAVTSPQHAEDVKGRFENFIKELAGAKNRK